MTGRFFLYYDRDGKPMDSVEEWAKELEKGRTIKKSYLWFGLMMVSTVWLGLDHDFTYGIRKGKPNPHPLIFETLVFYRHGRVGGQWRYSTEAEARAGHRKVVRQMLNPLHAWREWKADE